MHVGDGAHGARDHAIGLGFRVRHFQRLDQLVAERAAAGLGSQAREHALHGVGQQVDHARQRADFVVAVRLAAIVHVARGQRLRDLAHGVDGMLDGPGDGPQQRAPRERGREQCAADQPGVVTVPARSASASTRVSTRCSTPRMRVMASRKPVSSARAARLEIGECPGGRAAAGGAVAQVVPRRLEVLRGRLPQAVGNRRDFRRRRQRPGGLELRAQRVHADSASPVRGPRAVTLQLGGDAGVQGERAIERALHGGDARQVRTGFRLCWWRAARRTRCRPRQQQDREHYVESAR